MLLVAYVLNKFKIRPVIIRKVMHIVLSFVWVISYIFLGNSFHLLIPPITFIIVNIIAYKYNIFEWVGDKPKGIVYYPISFLILSFITYLHPPFYYAFGIGFLCMGLADGLAPLVAGYLKSRELINNKTLTGCATVLVVSFLVAYGFELYFALGLNIIRIAIIAITAVLLELIGKDGLDNLYLPLGVAVIVYLLGVI